MITSGKFLLLDKKYQVDLGSKLGSGACGNVYLGYYYPSSGNSSHESELLAIKEIPITSKFEATDSLLREINLLRRWNHPNIVK
jgi:serine/threonine protein kinase